MPPRDGDAEATFVTDFSPDETRRRAAEIIRRCCGKPATFNLETGQPLDGSELSREELKRRGYQ